MTPAEYERALKKLDLKPSRIAGMFGATTRAEQFWRNPEGKGLPQAQSIVLRLMIRRKIGAKEIEEICGIQWDDDEKRHRPIGNKRKGQ